MHGIKLSRKEFPILSNSFIIVGQHAFVLDHDPEKKYGYGGSAKIKKAKYYSWDKFTHYIHQILEKAKNKDRENLFNLLAWFLHSIWNDINNLLELCSNIKHITGEKLSEDIDSSILKYMVSQLIDLFDEQIDNLPPTVKNSFLIFKDHVKNPQKPTYVENFSNMLSAIQQYRDSENYKEKEKEIEHELADQKFNEEKLYAAKIFHENQPGSSNSIDRESEICRLLGRTAVQIRYKKNIVIMDYIGEKDLFTFINTKDEAEIKNIPLEERLRVFKHFLEEIKKLHKAGYIIGDIKPENIRIKYNKETNRFDVFEIVDFSEVVLKNENKTAAITPPYISPELIKEAYKQGLVPTQSSDIYAAGLIMMFLSPEYVEPKKNPIPVIPDFAYSKKFKDKPKDQRGIEIQKLLKDMLQDNPKDRASIEECCERLGNILKNHKTKHIFTSSNLFTPPSEQNKENIGYFHNIATPNP